MAQYHSTKLCADVWSEHNNSKRKKYETFFLSQSVIWRVSRSFLKWVQMRRVQCVFVHICRCNGSYRNHPIFFSAVSRMTAIMVFNFSSKPFYLSDQFSNKNKMKNKILSAILEKYVQGRLRQKQRQWQQTPNIKYICTFSQILQKNAISMS